MADRDFAHDLNLDQVFEALLAGREQFDLLPLLYSPLTDLDGVAYRHEVLSDLERPVIAEVVRDFGKAMRAVRDILGAIRKLHNRWQQERLFLEAVTAYCSQVESLARRLGELEVVSRGMRNFTEYAKVYVTSQPFLTLRHEADDIANDLGGIRYGVHIRGARVTVTNYGGEPDYAKEVEEVFTKFRKGAVKDYRMNFRSLLDMDHIEGQVLNFVARLNPGPFEALDRYFRANQGFLDAVVSEFERGSQFYLAYLDFLAPLRHAGLAFCYPTLSAAPGTTRAKSTFDLALAAKVGRAAKGTAAQTSPDGDEDVQRANIEQDGLFASAGVVSNDLDLGLGERIMIVTGPNSGGKTTFARAVGQLHYLASLGLPVPGQEADIVLADRVFTSFQQAERLEAARSHLEDELVHLHEVIEQATPSSVVIMNESFASTTLRDAAVLAKAVLAHLVSCGAFCMYVTFIDELASVYEGTVSMVATVDPRDPTVRTFKLVRKPPEGLAYAAALAERYGLTYKAVREQVGQ